MTKVVLFPNEKNQCIALKDALSKLPVFPRIVLFVTLENTGIVNDEQIELQNMVLKGVGKYFYRKINLVQGNTELTEQTSVWGIEYSPEDTECIIAYVYDEEGID